MSLSSSTSMASLGERRQEDRRLPQQEAKRGGPLRAQPPSQVSTTEHEVQTGRNRTFSHVHAALAASVRSPESRRSRAAERGGRYPRMPDPSMLIKIPPASALPRFVYVPRSHETTSSTSTTQDSVDSEESGWGGGDSTRERSPGSRNYTGGKKEGNACMMAILHHSDSCFFSDGVARAVFH